MTSELKRPVRRRIGQLMIIVTDSGVVLRASRSRKPFRLVTWQEIATLADDERAMIITSEHEAGQRILRDQRADPSAKVEKAKRP